MFNMKTQRLPHYEAIGGGVPVGGTLHAGNAYWKSTITPSTAAPERYPALPSPSLYVTPHPRDLPSIVLKPFRLARGMKKIGGVLDDGFSRVAVVGEEGEAVQLMNQDVNMFRRDVQQTFEGFRQPSEVYASAASSPGTTMTTASSGRGSAMDTRSSSIKDVNVVGGGLVDLDIGFDPMEEDQGGALGVRRDTPAPPPQPGVSTSRVNQTTTHPQKSMRKSKKLPVLNSSDNVFNITPTTVNDDLRAAMSMALNERRSALREDDDYDVNMSPVSSEDF